MIRNALLACVLVLAGAGCGGIPVEGATWRASAESSGAVPTSVLRTAAVADATFTSLPDWSDRSLGEAEWLMAGTSDAPATWFAVVSFDLSVLPRHEPIASASLRLAVRNDPPLDPPAREERFPIHHVVDDWEEGAATWSSAPWIHEEPVGWLVVRPDNSGWDVAELTEHFVRALGAGQQRVTLAVVPGEGSAGFRRLWSSRETLPDDPTTAVSTAPTLEVTFGHPPPGRSAAARDSARTR